MTHPMLISYGILLVSHLTIIYGRAHRLVVQTIPDNDLKGSCAFELEGFRFNLCPLLEESHLINVHLDDDLDKGEGSSTGSRLFYVALGGMGKGSGFVEENSRYSAQGSECNADTWVCLLDEQSGRGRSIAGSVKANNNGQSSRRRRRRYPLKSTALLEIEDGGKDTSVHPLQLSLYGGDFQNERQVAKFTFFCSDDKSLRYIGEDKGVHSFSWATSHGCPARLNRKTAVNVHLVANEESANDNEGESPEEEEEKNEGDGDLLPSHHSKTRRWVVITVVLVVALLCAFVLLSSRARNLATENLKGATYTIFPLLSHAVLKLIQMGRSLNNFKPKLIVRLGSRFRQGDSRLVQWAQEDMSLEDSEDVMVNGSGAFDRDELWNTDGSGEYIPLAFSPQYGYGRRGRSYGATPDVETFAERSSLAKLFGR